MIDAPVATECVEFETMAGKASTETRLTVLEHRLKWSIAIGAFLIVALLGVLGWIATTLFRQGERLAAIEGQLKTFVPNAVAQILERSPTSRMDADQRLAAASAVLDMARRKRVPSDPAALEATSRLLLKDTEDYSDLPSAWQLAAKLVTYRSEQQPYGALSSMTLPSCEGQPPILQMQGPIPAGKQTVHVQAYLYRWCRLLLNSETAGRINRDQFSVKHIFQHCIVVYNGDALTLRNDLVFENSVFLFSFDGIPPPAGQRLTRALLASSGDKIEVNALLEGDAAIIFPTFWAAAPDEQRPSLIPFLTQKLDEMAAEWRRNRLRKTLNGGRRSPFSSPKRAGRLMLIAYRCLPNAKIPNGYPT